MNLIKEREQLNIEFMVVSNLCMVYFSTKTSSAIKKVLLAKDWYKAKDDDLTNIISSMYEEMSTF